MKEMSARSMPTSVKNQIHRANHPQYGEMIARNSYCAACVRDTRLAVYIPMGKTLLHETGS